MPSSTCISREARFIEQHTFTCVSSFLRSFGLTCRYEHSPSLHMQELRRAGRWCSRICSKPHIAELGMLASYRLFVVRRHVHPPGAERPCPPPSVLCPLSSALCLLRILSSRLFLDVYFWTSPFRLDRALAIFNVRN